MDAEQKNAELDLAALRRLAESNRNMPGAIKLSSEQTLSLLDRLETLTAERNQLFTMAFNVHRRHDAEIESDEWDDLEAALVAILNAPDAVEHE